MKGYAQAIEVTMSVATKLWVLRDGIWLCISLNLPAMEIELGVKVVINLMGRENGRSNSTNVIVSDCKEGLKKIPFVRINYCFREANKYANALARRGALLPIDFFIYIHPPLDVVMLLNLDASGTLYDHFVTSALEAI